MPRKLVDPPIKAIVALSLAGGTLRSIAQATGISRSSISRLLRERAGLIKSKPRGKMGRPRGTGKHA